MSNSLTVIIPTYNSTKYIGKVKYDDDNIPRPNFWGGFALKPEEFEFWEDGDFRFHDRFILKPTNVKNEWIAKRHYP